MFQAAPLCNELLFFPKNCKHLKKGEVSTPLPSESSCSRCLEQPNGRTDCADDGAGVPIMLQAAAHTCIHICHLVSQHRLLCATQ